VSELLSKIFQKEVLAWVLMLCLLGAHVSRSVEDHSPAKQTGAGRDPLRRVPCRYASRQHTVVVRVSRDVGDPKRLSPLLVSPCLDAHPTLKPGGHYGTDT